MIRLFKYCRLETILASERWLERQPEDQIVFDMVNLSAEISGTEIPGLAGVSIEMKDCCLDNLKPDPAWVLVGNTTNLQKRTVTVVDKKVIELDGGNIEIYNSEERVEILARCWGGE